MHRGIFIAIALAVAATLVASSGCIFKKQPYKGVMSYRHGKVFIRKGDFYRVGELPSGWKRMHSGARAISFYSEADKSSISTDAFCGTSIGNRTLSSLGGEIASALESRTVVKEEAFMLDGRGALRRHVEGKIDGVPTAVDLVVARKNECIFDFYLVAPKGADDAARADFEAFFNAFHYE